MPKLDVTSDPPLRPIEPPLTKWKFPPLDLQNRANHLNDDLIATGADLEPGTLLTAYRSGCFPLPIDETNGIGWWSPKKRGILELDQLNVSRSLRRSIRRYRIRINSSFAEVIKTCSNLERPQGWINSEMISAYNKLHQMGWAHSVEAWSSEGLAGGLYGIGIGNFFAGESMFHHQTDASKVALIALVRLLQNNPGALLDIQWTTPHFKSLGATEIKRSVYLKRLLTATTLPGPIWSSLH